MKHPLIKGALILTIAGFITRFLGFFYKLILSRILGPEQLGIYQLIFPVYSLCYTIYASGMQPAISKAVAPYGSAATKPSKKILTNGCKLSLFIALCCSIVLYSFSHFIAEVLLKEPRCASGLQILALVFPFCSISACINGYYYGQKQTLHPSIAQLVEQITRIAFSMLFVFPILSRFSTFSYTTAIASIVVGELCAMIYNCIVISCSHPKKDSLHDFSVSSWIISRQLLSHAIPLTASHFVTTLLHSAEAILIPNLLLLYGMSQSESLSIYGILTGMTMPILLFPSTLIHSFTVLLLPSVSEAHARKKYGYIYKTTCQACFFSALLGFAFSVFFLLFGPQIGILLFDNALVGSYLQNLAFLCPMLYINHILTSVLNGLGKTSIIFRNTVLSQLLKIFLLCICIKTYGIAGYFFAMLFAQLFSSCLDLFSVLSIKKHRNET